MNVLSLCMIVKNEEHNLDKCLSSAKPYVDEIIVVDTGSTDKTKEIAAKYTDNIYDFEWINDFSAARNFSISKAKNDWIIVLDADESITDWEVLSTRRFINDKKRKKDVGTITIVNKIDEHFQKGVIHENDVPRVFNKKYCSYSGTIHEQVYVDGDERKPMQQIGLNIKVFHSGYTKAEFAIKGKRGRNREILEEELKKTPNNPYYKYQLGKEYISDGQRDKGLALLEDAISDPETVKSGYFPDAIHCLGSTYCICGRYEDALKLKKYEPFLSRSSDYRYILGNAYIAHESYIEAAFQFLNAIQIKNAAAKGVDTYLAFEGMGICYQNLGELDDALMFYEKAYKEYDYLPAKIRYDELKRLMELNATE